MPIIDKANINGTLYDISDSNVGRLGNAIGMQGWNQMLNTSGVTTRTHFGITFTTNSNGTITLSGTSTRQEYSNNFPNMSTIANHKYLAILHGASDTGAVSLYNSTDNKFARGNGIIYTAGGTRDIGLNVMVNGTGITLESLVVTPQMYDLTAIFGTGNEPATVAEFRKLFPASYYPFCSPNHVRIYQSGTNWVKYDDGRAECWGTYYQNHVEFNSQWGYMYYTNLNTISYPITFISDPVSTVNNFGTYSAMVMGYTSNTTGITNLQLCRATSGTAETIGIKYHAIGRWK